jgi:Protein of unknown function (DUF3231)
MDNKKKLTSTEMATLWTQYINDSASICVIGYFINSVKSKKIKYILEDAMKSAVTQLDIVTKLFKKHNFPIPIGFNKSDVNLEASPLFGDIFIVHYLKNMSVLGMSASSLADSGATNPDGIRIFKLVYQNAYKLSTQAREFLMNEDCYPFPPHIDTPKKATMITQQEFLGNFFGEQRPLSAIEISHLVRNTQINFIGRSLITGFAQVTRAKEIQEYFKRGIKVAEKQIETFSEKLRKDQLQASLPTEVMVTDSRESPFSEKLMLFHVTAMNASGIGNYGLSMSASPRRDIGMSYAKLLMDIALYAEDGANLMIKNAWLEKPPMATERGF